MYQVGEFYTPEFEGGLLYNDPRLALKWPLPVSVISEKDQAWHEREVYLGKIVCPAERRR